MIMIVLLLDWVGLGRDQATSVIGAAWNSRMAVVPVKVAEVAKRAPLRAPM